MKRLNPPQTMMWRLAPIVAFSMLASTALLSAQTPSACGAGPGLYRDLCRIMFQTARFQTPHGVIEITMPSFTPAGEQVSSRVMFFPQGRTEEETQTSRSLLSSYVLKWGDRTIPLDRGFVEITMPETGKGTSIPLSLFTENAESQVMRSARTIVFSNSFRSARRSSFSVPAVWDRRSALIVYGPFDGRLSNTVVSDDKGQWLTLTETTRMLLLAPREIDGPLQVTIREADTPIHASRIHLFALDMFPDSNSNRGKPQADVKLSGLSGLRDPVELRLDPDAVSKVLSHDAGTLFFRPWYWRPRWATPYHRIRITPSSVPASGTVTVRVETKGTSNLGFSAVIAAAPKWPQVVRQGIDLWSADNSVEVTAGAKSEIARQFDENNDILYERWTAVDRQFFDYRDFLDFTIRLYLYELRDRSPQSKRAASGFSPLVFAYAQGTGSPERLGDSAPRSFTLRDLLKTVWFRLLLKEAIVEVQTDPTGMMLAVDDQSRSPTNRMLSLPVGEHTFEMQKDRSGCSCSVIYTRPGLQAPLICKNEISPGCVRR